MTSLVFDLEANGLLDTITKVWCIAIYDRNTKEQVVYGPDQIGTALQHLSTADELVAHNALGYDIQALKQVYGWVPKAGCKVIDTLLLSYLLYSDRALDDSKSTDEDIEALKGKHSLAAWGTRLKQPKSEYAGGWDAWSQEMSDYCLQDVVVCEEIYRYFLSQKRISWPAYDLEAQFFLIADRMEKRGISFDMEAAVKLHTHLQEQINLIVDDIRKDIPPELEVMKTPQYWELRWKCGEEDKAERRPTRGECDTLRKSLKIKPKDCTFEPGPMKVNQIEFNVNSRPQVRKYLYEKYGWLSSKLTEGGEKLLNTATYDKLAMEYGSLSEEILRDCEHPEGQKFADYFLLSKVSSFLSNNEGEKGWISLCREGRIHGRTLSMGAATFRVCHSRPNISQTPAVSLDKEKKPKLGIAGRFGWECRSLFKATEGFKLVGADLSGIEARMLAHFLAPADGGKYIQKVLEGDIHADNSASFLKYAGYNISRNNGKTLLYAYIYSAGDMKLGQSATACSVEAQEDMQSLRRGFKAKPFSIKQQVWSSATKSRRTATPDEAALMVVGSKIRSALEQGIEGMGVLMETLAAASKKGYLNILDRRVPVRAARSSLNTCLQSSAAIVAKRWVCLTEDSCNRDGLNWHPLAFLHDELEAEVLSEQAEHYRQNCLAAIVATGESFGLRIPLSGDCRIGETWAIVH